MTREFSNYMKRFCNLNLDIKSIRQKDRHTKTETDRQTDRQNERQKKKEEMERKRNEKKNMSYR